MTDKRKVAGLVLAGVLLLLVGVLWSLVFPINKKLWSSSFVCVVGAYSVLDVRPVLLHCRCVGMAEMDFLLPGDRG